jgi:hypothetical protein
VNGLDVTARFRRYCGHTEVVKGIVKLRRNGGYATCSWDRTLRVWRDHIKSPELQEQHAKILHVHDPFAARKADVEMSEYEKSHPRFEPPSLSVRHAIAQF